MYTQNLTNHKIENMASLDDAVEITVHPDANSSAIFKLYAEKIDYPPFSRSEIAQMSNEEYLKYEPLIMEQLKNGDFKEQNQTTPSIQIL